MTLIAGLMCIDGILLCSDTEESTEAGDKGSVRKILDCHDDSCSLAIATAGHSALCDVAVKRIREAAQKAGNKFVHDHEDIIGTVLCNLHKKYIWPDHVPKEREIALIIALHARVNDERHLYLTCDEILQPKDGYACAGIGESIGSYFLERLYEQSLTLVETTELMAFITREAKDSVGSVGRETEMVSLHKDGIIGRSFSTRAMDRDIPHLWQCIEKFWKLKPKL